MSNYKVNSPLNPPPTLQEEAAAMGVDATVDNSDISTKPEPTRITIDPDANIPDWQQLAQDPNVKPYKSIAEAARVESAVDPNTGASVLSNPKAAAYHTARLSKIMMQQDPVSGAVNAPLGDSTPAPSVPPNSDNVERKDGLVQGVDGRTEYTASFDSVEDE